MKIALLSDTHSYIDDRILEHCKDCNEIWHAGDIGSIDIIQTLKKVAPVRVVYGNIDDASLRHEFNRDLIFNCEGLKVFITHIGGYPTKYNKRVRKQLAEIKPNIFICGHSHILKVMRDKEFKLIHMNPGACGIFGFHQVRTMLRFDINGTKVENLEAIELGHRGKINYEEE